MIKDKRILVFVNNEQVLLKIKKNLSFSKKNFISFITIGNSELKNDGFIGKISNCYLLTKNIEAHHVSVVYSLSAKYSINCFPYNLASDSLKILKDIKESVLIDVLDEAIKDPSETMNAQGIYHIFSMNLFDTLKAYGLKRLLIQFFEACNDFSSLKFFYQIVLVLVSQNDYIDKDFVRYFSHIFTNKPLNTELCRTYFEILQASTTKNIQKALMGNIVHSAESVMILSKTEYFDEFIHKYKNFYSFSKENFYEFCGIMKNLYEDTRKKYLKYYLDDDFIVINKDEIGQVLVNLVFSDFYEVIKSVLETISEFSLNYLNVSSIVGAFLQILKELNDC